MHLSGTCNEHIYHMNARMLDAVDVLTRLEVTICGKQSRVDPELLQLSLLLHP